MRWSNEEISTLFQMRAAGEKWTVIAATLGRDYDSTVSFYRDERRRLKRVPKLVYRKERVGGSFELAERINAAILSFAQDNRITVQQARDRLLGPGNTPTIPGTERRYKTCSIERLAA